MKKLSQKEKVVLVALRTKLRIPQRKTRTQVALAMIGLVGSGKTAVAREVASEVGAVILSSEPIRNALHAKRLGFGAVQPITHALLDEVFAGGGNVVFDSDFIDTDKRKRFRAALQAHGVRLHFIRTHANRDVMIGRMLTKEPKPFFKKAVSAWSGIRRGNVVKLREFWRRTPHHYRWSREGGGKWLLKNLPVTLLADIDTTHEKKSRRDIKVLVRKLKLK